MLELEGVIETAEEEKAHAQKTLEEMRAAVAAGKTSADKVPLLRRAHAIRLLSCLRCNRAMSATILH